MSFVPSANLAQLKPSATIAVSARARALKAAGRNIIDLGAGEPDFATPEFIRRAAQRAIDAGATKYTATEGILPLREAIAAAANAQRSAALPPVKPDEVVVSTGSKQSLYNACVALFGPGDEVLVPTPNWTSYYEMVGLARATPVAVHGDAARGFKVTPGDLARHATPRTRGVMLNSPCNPTGSVYSAAELGAILSLAHERQWWVISDEIYVRIAYGTPAARSLQLAESRERLVVVDGVAKAFAMTGWRVGWSISQAPLAQAMTAFQSHTTSNAAAVSQHAALTALTDTAAADAAVSAMVTQFKARRDAALAVLRSDPAIRVVPPDGAFYFFIEAPLVTGGGAAGDVFTATLIEQHDLAVVPGAAFLTPNWIRVSYAAEESLVLEGMRRIVAAHRAARA